MTFALAAISDNERTARSALIVLALGLLSHWSTPYSPSLSVVPADLFARISPVALQNYIWHQERVLTSLRAAETNGRVECKETWKGMSRHFNVTFLGCFHRSHPPVRLLNYILTQLH